MTWASETLADSPIWWARQDDTSGTTMTDAITGGSHNGTYTGTYTLNQTGLVLSDSSNPSVDFAGAKGTVTGAAWMQLSTFTVRAVIKPDTVPGGSGYAFIQARDVNGTAGPWWMALKGGKVSFLVVTGGGITEFVGNAVLTAGNTYYIWCTYDGANMRIDINGSTDATQAKTGTPTVNTVDIVVGNWTGANLPFDGKIDETALFPAMNATRTAAQYAAGIAGDATVSVPLATATSTALVPTVSADASPTIPVATATATALVPTVTAANDATVLVPLATATAQALVPGLAFDYDADSSNAFGGRTRDGFATVELSIPITPPLAAAPVRVDKAIKLPTPVLVKGRPT